jgi:glycine hydroxymethyltransferase
MESLLAKYSAAIPPEKRRSSVIAYLAALDHLFEKAPTIAQQILNELKTQRSTLKLIASENYCSLSVQLAMGNLLTDKYSEGYPYHRFYAGCENVDAVETEAAERAKALFGAEHAFVQPHSGADANLIAFWAILAHKIQNPHLEKIGKKNLDALSPAEFEQLRQLLCNQSFLGLGLSSGGHLTHGFRQNVSAKMMRAFSYEVDPKTHLLDYGAIATLAREVKPLILLAGYSAYPRRFNFAKMREIADEVGAVLMVDMAHFAGLVAGKAHPGEEDPVPYAHIITSTTHKTLRGPRGGLVLSTLEFAESVNKACPYVMGGPLPHVIAAKAIAFEENQQPEFQTYASRIIENARALAEGLLKKGVQVVTGGTDNHLVLIDVSKLGITGRIAETALTDAGITANRNMVPYDPNGAWYTSGIRLGTAALTTLGMGKVEMEEVSDLIAKILQHTRPKMSDKGEMSKSKGETDPKITDEVRRRIQLLLQRYPLYPELMI